MIAPIDDQIRQLLISMGLNTDKAVAKGLGEFVEGGSFEERMHKEDQLALQCLILQSQLNDRKTLEAAFRLLSKYVPENVFVDIRNEYRRRKQTNQLAERFPELFEFKMPEFVAPSKERSDQMYRGLRFLRDISWSVGDPPSKACRFIRDTSEFVSLTPEERHMVVFDNLWQKEVMTFPDYGVLVSLPFGRWSESMRMIHVPWHEGIVTVQQLLRAISRWYRSPLTDGEIDEIQAFASGCDMHRYYREALRKHARGQHPLRISVMGDLRQFEGLKPRGFQTWKLMLGS